MRRSTVLLCAVALHGAGHAQGGEVLHNWFNDPFFQISNAIAGCPMPAGPFMTEAERLVQSHHRAEKGTTCWLAGRCDKPSFYADDEDIAQALRALLAAQNPFVDSTLWVTVQGRVVYIEGCVRDAAVGRDLEVMARSLPQVLQAVAAVSAPGAERPPYKRMPARQPAQ